MKCELIGLTTLRYDPDSSRFLRSIEVRHIDGLKATPRLDRFRVIGNYSLRKQKRAAALSSQDKESQ